MELEPFLAPVDPTNPSGSELRNDHRFHAIERLMEPAARALRLESINAGGTGSVAVDWGNIIELSAELAPTGRDLRLLVIVARALANADGFSGLERGLAMLTGTIDQHWDTVHPLLRDSPSLREAATRRINSLYQLENADNGLLCDLEFRIVLSPRGIGPVTGGDLCAAALTRSAAQMELPSGLGEKERAELLVKHDARVSRATAACRALAAEQPEELVGLVTSIEAAKVALAGLEAALTGRVGENGMTFRFKELEKALTRMMVPLQTAQSGAQTGVEPGPPETEQVSMSEPSAPAPVMNGAASPAAAAASGVPGSVNSRRDVERCLDMIIAFYERTEPSSPIPHLARRMRKMVPMNFLQLMEEIAPSGMKEFKNVAGVDDRSKSAAP